MTFNRFFSTCLAALSVLGCVTPFDPETQTLPPTLVIDGLITDQPGPYTVRLSFTADYTVSALNLLASGATATIVDDRGTQFPLREVGTGIYQTTPEVRGQVGRSYSVRIRFQGEQYESLPERLNAAPAITNVSAEYEERPRPNGVIPDKGFNVFVDSKDPDTLGNYYRWTWAGYRPIVICDIRPVPNSRPPSFSGRNCCSTCWAVDRCFNNCINVATDQAINGGAISGQPIFRAPFDSFAPYYVEIEQQSLTARAYRYWSSVKAQTDNTGGLFDAAPAPIVGNVRCTSTPGRTVFGYFGASGSSAVGYQVIRNNVAAQPNLRGEDPPVPQPSECAVCSETIARTARKPRFWPN